MKVVLEIKNLKMNEPLSNESIILYDASDKRWYITSKTDLLSEFNLRNKEAVDKFEAKNKELEEKWENFMKDYTEQNSKLIPILEAIISKEKI